MSRTFRPAVLLALLASTALTAAAQTAPTPPDQPAFTLHAGTRLVLTDVAVTDRNGNAVQNLPKSAFHIFDGNAPQEIRSFEEHTAPAYTAAATEAPPARPQGVYSNDFLLHPPPVLNVMVIDITNLRIEDQMYLNFQLTQFLENLPAGEPLAIYQRDGPISVMLQSFTSDHKLLLAALHRAIPRFPPTGTIYLSDLDTLRQIATYLGDLPGRKNVLWFSGGSTLYLNPENLPMQDEVAVRRIYDLLEASRIAVYPIDARGLTVVFGRNAGIQNLQHLQMNEVAEATGGHAFFNTNGLKQTAARITSGDGNFYTLTYSPHDYKQDNHWHKVRVTLDSPGLSLSYRRGYFADGINGAPTSTERNGPVNRLLAGGGTATDRQPARTMPIVFEARVLPTSQASGSPNAPAKPKRGAIPYSIEYSVPADSVTISSVDGKSVVRLIVASFAFSQGGSVLDRHVQSMTLTLNQDRLRENPKFNLPLNQQLDLAKGQVYLLLAVMDQGSGRTGNLQIAMQVPAAPK